jgi:Domain of unknown function (DUF6438)
MRESVYRLTILGALALIGGGCRRSAAGKALTVPVVHLERGACYRACAEYAVDLFRDGSVRFTGTKNVAKLGEHRSSISKKSVTALLTRFRESGFLATDSAYVMAAPRCGAYVPDAPTLQLTAVFDDVTHRVRLETGCTGAPAFLKSLAAQVDSVANATQWITANNGKTP